MRSVRFSAYHLACPETSVARPRSSSNSVLLFFSGIVAEEADRPIFFHPDGGQLLRRRTLSFSSISSIIDGAEDPFNFSVYMDKVHRSAVNSLPHIFAHQSRASCRLR